MTTSPSTDNYQIGKGVVSFKKTGEGSYRDLGNVSELEWTPEVESLDHFSSRTGIRTKDKSVVVTSGATLRMVMDEMTAQNLQLLVLGDIEADTDGNSAIESMTLSSVEGMIKVVGTNDVGPKMEFEGKVSFKPSGSFNFISEEWNTIEVTGEMVQETGYGLGFFSFHDETV